MLSWSLTIDKGAAAWSNSAESVTGEAGPAAQQARKEQESNTAQCLPGARSSRLHEQRKWQGICQAL